jgi:hypothetical protein
MNVLLASHTFLSVCLSIYVCMYVRTYVCMCIYVYVSMYVCMYVTLYEYLNHLISKEIYGFVYLLTNSMEQSPPRKSNRFAASQEISHILWNPKVRYHTSARHLSLSSARSIQFIYPHSTS